MSFIETARLLLRTWVVPGDVADARAIFSDAEVMRYIAHPLIQAPELPAYLEGLNAITEREPALGLWPIVEKASGRLIGDCGLLHIPNSGEVEICWHLRRDAWGHGFITEAATAVLDYGFTQVRLRRIYALIDPMNARSIRVAHRLGMRFDRVARAYHRDLLRYYRENGYE